MDRSQGPVAWLPPVARGASSLANLGSGRPRCCRMVAEATRCPIVCWNPACAACCAGPMTNDDDADVARNGYRSAKPQGKPNFTIGNFSLCSRHFCDFALGGTMRAFTPRSSRTLNCPSNLMGHDHPNNRPENGVGNDRV